MKCQNKILKFLSTTKINNKIFKMSNNQLQNLPITLIDALILDDSFSSMKQRFVAEMRRIDEEMTKFSNNIGLHGQSTAQSDTAASGIGKYDFTNSPIIDGEGENRILKLQFDVSQFNPNEVTVSILDSKLIVSALHEEKSDTSTTYRKYHREFHFPKEVNPETIVSSLSKDGVLVVQAPLPALPYTALTK